MSKRIKVVPKFGPIKLAFCPTGPGGGTDNSCGSHMSERTAGRLEKSAILRGDMMGVPQKVLKASTKADKLTEIAEQKSYEAKQLGTPKANAAAAGAHDKAANAHSQAMLAIEAPGNTKWNASKDVERLHRHHDKMAEDHDNKAEAHYYKTDM